MGSDAACHQQHGDDQVCGCFSQVAKNRTTSALKRTWTGQRVLFDFPIVAIVGENGSGKSRLLQAAACVPGAGQRADLLPE